MSSLTIEQELKLQLAIMPAELQRQVLDYARRVVSFPQ